MKNLVIKHLLVKYQDSIELNFRFFYLVFNPLIKWSLMGTLELVSEPDDLNDSFTFDLNNETIKDGCKCCLI